MASCVLAALRVGIGLVFAWGRTAPTARNRQNTEKKGPGAASKKRGIKFLPDANGPDAGSGRFNSRQNCFWLS
eukprot:2161878-Rhodomonas_salina.1